jgi:hypothetical protein
MPVSETILTHQKHGVAELMRLVSVLIEFAVCFSQRFIVGERPQEFVMARARLVGSAQNRIDNA